MDTLKKLRKKKEKTQYQIAKALGISRAAYNSYELGTREPSIEILIKLSQLFDVSIDYILTGKEHSKSEVQYLFDLLPDYKQNRVLGYIRSLAEDEGLVIKSNR